jgi:hypothetical protein
MSIGLFINNFTPTEKSKDPGLIAESLVKLGQEVTLYCLKTDVTDWAGIKIKTITKTELNSPVFWAQEAAPVLIIYSWLSLRYSRLIKILEQLGKKIILKLDSDGHLIYPLAPSYLRVLGITSSLPDRLIHLLRLVQWTFLPKIISRRKIKQIARAAALIIESPLAQKNLQQSLIYWRREDLTKKIVFIPNPAAISIKNSSGDKPRENLIISIGRWSDKRKNGVKIVKVLSTLSVPNWKFLLIGAGSEKLKEKINKKNPTLKINSLEAVPHAEIPDYLKRGKIFFAPSLADSFNLAAAEALSCGLSLAVTPLESFIYFTANGRFGTTAKNFKIKNIASALKTEMTKWENNYYRPEENAVNWQKELNPEKIGRQIRELIANL